MILNKYLDKYLFSIILNFFTLVSSVRSTSSENAEEDLEYGIGPFGTWAIWGFLEIRDLRSIRGL